MFKLHLQRHELMAHFHFPHPARLQPINSPLVALFMDKCLCNASFPRFLFYFESITKWRGILEFEAVHGPTVWGHGHWESFLNSSHWLRNYGMCVLHNGKRNWSRDRPTLPFRTRPRANCERLSPVWVRWTLRTGHVLHSETGMRRELFHEIELFKYTIVCALLKILCHLVCHWTLDIVCHCQIAPSHWW